MSNSEKNFYAPRIVLKFSHFLHELISGLTETFVSSCSAGDFFSSLETDLCRVCLVFSVAIFFLRK